MNTYKAGKIELIQADCLEYLDTIPDQFFELAIVDPPYGWGGKSKLNGRNVNGSAEWNTRPSAQYFSELFRVSQNQIIWGGNYFDLPPCRGFIVWDKKQPITTFARCEFAWCSMDRNAKIFEHAYFGGVNQNPGRFHPTQKPITLYKWLLTNYAKPGDHILDTHLGSGSIAIAAHDLGFALTGTEIDSEYLEKAKKRLIQHTSQLQIF